MTLLKLSGLSRTYGENAVLDGLDLTLEPGQAIALTGANGSGKSTLLRCVAGADQPTAGEVLLDGEAYDERSARVRRDVATLLDDLDLFPDLAVVEHLDLVAHAHRVEDPTDTVDRVLDEVGLTGQASQLPGSLSSGQRQRLGLASMLVRPRRLLLLDEPEQRLDADGAHWLAGLLAREKEAGVGILFASHQPALIEAVADEVVRLGSPASTE
jgi:heme ABC exporter ATP-binding subunit CcmA